jgi:anti-sigma factor RsiW
MCEGQIAAVLGISLPAAKQRLRRGRMILVSALAHGRERRAANSSVPLSCWDAREQVSGYLDGDLDASARAALEVHLANCATCPPLFQALVGVRASLGALRDPDSVVPAELAGRVRAHLAGTGARGSSERRGDGAKGLSGSLISWAWWGRRSHHRMAGAYLPASAGRLHDLIVRLLAPSELGVLG